MKHGFIDHKIDTNLPSLDDISPTDDPPIIPPTQKMDTTKDQTAVTSAFVMSHFA